MAGVLRISFCSSLPSQLTCSVRGLRTSARRLQEAAKEEIVGIPYSKLTLGVPKESWLNEKRVAISPAATAMLVKKGFTVNVESGAGKLSQFPDDAYAAEGSKIVEKAAAFQEDITLKLRQPSIEEAALLRDNATLYSFLYPAQNKELVDALAAKKMTAFGMDCVPRISRAQVFDALSSMGNISGYRAVVEASNHYGRFFAGQVTAAGKVPPTKVLVIGGGVAGLAAVQQAKNMGAIVRCFDVRPAVKEQVESMGGEFLEVEIEEDGSTEGGYAKEMSKEFIEAEMALFHEQCKDVDIVITTALIPGKKAPILIKKYMVDDMKPGSVVVDLAAEAGGNIETITPGEVTVYNDVTHIGYSDLPSRLPTQASNLYANNISKLLLSMTGSKDHYHLDMADDVVRGSIVLNQGVMSWPPNPPISTSAAGGAAGAAAVEKPGVLLGMGNPLLDITATVNPDLLAKYNLKANDAILTEDETIFEDMKRYKLDYIAGGATQNSIRVAQWILGEKDATAYFGCVGRDATGKILAEKAREAGVNVQYQINTKYPTGRCAVLITGQHRSLVTKLDAAEHYNVSHLEEADNWKTVEAAKVVYSAGFFLTVSVESMLKVAQHCADNDKTYCLNLSAPFLIQSFKDQMKTILPFADIVFGNETEAAKYAKVHFPKVKDVDIAQIAKKISMQPKENGGKGRIVIITQGTEPVIVVKHGKVLQFPVPSLPKKKIVDTNGAGDAFVGGFLAQYVQDKPLETAVRCGIWAATHIIQRSGCTYAPTCDFS